MLAGRRAGTETGGQRNGRLGRQASEVLMIGVRQWVVERVVLLADG